MNTISRVQKLSKIRSCITGSIPKVFRDPIPDCIANSPKARGHIPVISESVVKVWECFVDQMAGTRYVISVPLSARCDIKCSVKS